MIIDKKLRTRQNSASVLIRRDLAFFWPLVTPCLTVRAMATLARAVRGLARPAHSLLCTRALPQRALSTLSPRTLSTAAAAIDEEAEWAAAFKDATDAFSGEDSHETSAQRMRELVKSGLLRHTDLRDRPDRFFEAHRLLARRAVSEGPGFWIRFTVHYNLCYGTVCLRR